MSRTEKELIDVIVKFPFPIELVERLHKAGKFREVVKEFKPRLKRAYSAFSTDKHPEHFELFNEIMQYINPYLDSLDDLSKQGDNDYINLIEEAKKLEPTALLEDLAKTAKQLDETNTSLTEVIQKAEDYKRKMEEYKDRIKDLEKQSLSPDVQREIELYKEKLDFYSSFIDNYKNYFSLINNINRDYETDLINTFDISNIKRSLKDIKDFKRINLTKFSDTSIDKLIYCAETAFEQMKKKDIAVIDGIYYKYNYSEKEIKRMLDYDRERIHNILNKCINALRTYRLEV